MDRASRDAATGVEQLSEQIAELVAERQQLRTAGASYEVLEQNRVLLGRSQWALCHALIARHLPAFLPV